MGLHFWGFSFLKLANWQEWQELKCMNGPFMQVIFYGSKK
jgi:hypothetical protein